MQKRYWDSKRLLQTHRTFFAKKFFLLCFSCLALSKRSQRTTRPLSVNGIKLKDYGDNANKHINMKISKQLV